MVEHWLTVEELATALERFASLPAHSLERRYADRRIVEGARLWLEHLAKDLPAHPYPICEYCKQDLTFNVVGRQFVHQNGSLRCTDSDFPFAVAKPDFSAWFS